MIRMQSKRFVIIVVILSTMMLTSLMRASQTAQAGRSIVDSTGYTLQFSQISYPFVATSTGIYANGSVQMIWYNSSALNLTLGSGYYHIVFGSQGAANSVPIPPFPLQEGKFVVNQYLVVVINQAGSFSIDIDLSYNNPSVHWRAFCGSRYLVTPDDPGKFDTSSASFSASPDYYLVNRQQTVYNVAHTSFSVNVLVVPATLHFTFDSHSCYTDITGPNGIPDGKVDMRDIGAEARQNGVTYDSLTDPLTKYDMNLDRTIDLRDIGTVAKDFGFIVPP